MVKFHSEQRVTCLNVTPVVTSSCNRQIFWIHLAHDGDHKRTVQAVLYLHVPNTLLLVRKIGLCPIELVNFK